MSQFAVGVGPTVLRQGAAGDATRVPHYLGGEFGLEEGICDGCVGLVNLMAADIGFLISGNSVGFIAVIVAEGVLS